jgi:hypothetical protein
VSRSPLIFEWLLLKSEKKQKLVSVLSFNDNTEVNTTLQIHCWSNLDALEQLIIHLGFGATAGIDILITAMVYLVFYKDKLDIGATYISRQSDRFLTSLIT